MENENQSDQTALEKPRKKEQPIDLLAIQKYDFVDKRIAESRRMRILAKEKYIIFGWDEDQIKDHFDVSDAWIKKYRALDKWIDGRKNILDGRRAQLDLSMTDEDRSNLMIIYYRQVIALTQEKIMTLDSEDPEYDKKLARLNKVIIDTRKAERLEKGQETSHSKTDVDKIPGKKRFIPLADRDIYDIKPIDRSDVGELSDPESSSSIEEEDQASGRGEAGSEDNNRSMDYDQEY